MSIEIGAETLRSGETLRIEVVVPPDEERSPQILPFLQHKPPHYRAHIELAAEGRCDALETRYYIGLLGDRMVGNIMTVETQGVGIFGHVNTHPDHRRKGICAAVMQHQMQDFRNRNGHILLLGTGYQSHAYWIYHRFGFRDWPGSPNGRMRYDNPASPDFESRFFAPSPCRPAPARWRHWPLVALLASIPSKVHLRSLTLPVWGVSLLEGPYVGYMANYADRPNASAAVLETETGAVTAFATLVPDARWNNEVRLLDLFAHPGLNDAELDPLLAVLPLGSERTQCYADPYDIAKIAVLERAGFRREAVLPNQFSVGAERRDAWLFGR